AGRFDGPHGPRRGADPSDTGPADCLTHSVQTVNARMAIFTKKGKQCDTTGKVLYGSVATSNVFKGFGGTCEARNNGDAVVRYDQLAERWLIVMPVFTRGAVRPDQPPLWTRTDHAYVSPPGRTDQPGPAARLFQPPPVAAPAGAAPGPSGGAGQRA